MSRPLSDITGRDLATALLDMQALWGRPMSLDDALVDINAAWRCACTGALSLRGSACPLCFRCRCAKRVDADGTPCPICDHRLD